MSHSVRADTTEGSAQNCGTAQLITAHFVTHFRASFTTATTMYFMGEAFPTNSLFHSGLSEP